MVTPAVGDVVLVRFPFSDLSSHKVRPAVMLAEVGRDDWILCQITSKTYADTKSIEIDDVDFASGSLMRISYARPGKLFSANVTIMERIAGRLKQPKLAAVIDAVIDILRPSGAITT